MPPRILRFYVYRADDGWRWRLRAGNNRVIADSAEAYRDHREAVRMVALIRARVSTSETVDEAAP